MEITVALLQKSVAQLAFNSFEPFVTGEERAVTTFYDRVLSALECAPRVSVLRESEHHGSGCASYISAFLYPSDGSSRRDFPEYTGTTGILLYMSRFAPIAVFGASSRSDNKDNRGSSFGFIGVDNVGVLPVGDWADFLATVRELHEQFHVEVLPRDPLLLPAPANISIPTVFDGPYYVFDALFYWED